MKIDYVFKYTFYRLPENWKKQSKGSLQNHMMAHITKYGSNDMLIAFHRACAIATPKEFKALCERI